MKNVIHDSLFVFLSDHPILSKLIDIDTCGISRNKKPFPVYRENIHKQNLKNLQELESNKENIFLSIPQLPVVSKPNYMCNKHAFVFHKLQFLKYKYARFCKKAYLKYTDTLKLLMKIFTSFDVALADNIVIHVDFEELNNLVKRWHQKMSRIKHLYHHLIRIFHGFTNINTAELRRDFLDILSKTKSSLDPALNFFCPTPYQDDFEFIVFSPQFLVADQLFNIIKNFDNLTPIDFIKAIVKINMNIIQIHKIRKEDNSSLIITFLFRLFFDETYHKIKLFQVPELNFNLIEKLNKITIADIGPPLDYCPPETSPSKTPTEVFSKDQNYALSIDHIEYISLFTNPLDILHHINAALQEIEKAATIYSQKDELMLPFDVTFGLFICCLLSSDVPDFMRIAAFTDTYSPTFGLCADFEFSLAKLKTASIHLQNLAQKIIEKENKKIRKAQNKQKDTDYSENLDVNHM